MMRGANLLVCGGAEEDWRAGGLDALSHCDALGVGGVGPEVLEFRVQGLRVEGWRVEDWGLRIEGWGLRVEGSRVEGWGLRVEDWGLKVQGLRVEGWGLRIEGLGAGGDRHVNLGYRDGDGEIGNKGLGFWIQSVGFRV
jgi:hypothetical protein